MELLMSMEVLPFCSGFFTQENIQQFSTYTKTSDPATKPQSILLILNT
jgi:hypothetical protein